MARRDAEAVTLVRDLTSKFAKCDRHRSTPRDIVHGLVGKANRPRMRTQRSDKGTSRKRKCTRRGTLPQHAAGDKVFEKNSVKQRRLNSAAPRSPSADDIMEGQCLMLAHCCKDFDTHHNAHAAAKQVLSNEAIKPPRSGEIYSPKLTNLNWQKW